MRLHFNEVQIQGTSDLFSAELKNMFHSMPIFVLNMVLIIKNFEVTKKNFYMLWAFKIWAFKKLLDNKQQQGFYKAYSTWKSLSQSGTIFFWIDTS